MIGWEQLEKMTDKTPTQKSIPFDLNLKSMPFMNISRWFT
jgi:hypothetical protein